MGLGIQSGYKRVYLLCTPCCQILRPGCSKGSGVQLRLRGGVKVVVNVQPGDVIPVQKLLCPRTDQCLSMRICRVQIPSAGHLYNGFCLFLCPHMGGICIRNLQHLPGGLAPVGIDPGMHLQAYLLIFLQEHLKRVKILAPGCSPGIHPGSVIGVSIAAHLHEHIRKTILT